jgi:two-component system CheB/CheR fusion protein
VKTKKSGLKLQSFSETKVANELPIVGIGASAGGLDPIRKLLENLPVESGMAFVVIQHLAPGQDSLLPEILSRSTKMKVQQVQDGMQVEQGNVYVITPGTTMTLKNNQLRLVPKGLALKPINDFLISLASEKKTVAIGIVLSGTGNDGTEGLKAIKVEGGITFAQDPETAQYPDMPKNAIAAETSDFVLSPEQIAQEIAKIGHHPQLIRSETMSPKQEKAETDLKKIIMLLKTSFGVDFSHYRETTIDRRITRRMVINKTENMKEYVEYFRKRPNELQSLFDDLLIGVTSFFREPDTFVSLKEKVLPELVRNRSPNESIRVWIPGCSTGEEVYSFAITIQEFLEEKSIPEIRVQIFGTDANEKNIEKSRQGTYPKNIEDNVSENRLKRFFTFSSEHYHISKSIRDMCIFAKQDITTDPPFSNIDLIMCRNVLIYFDSYLHERMLRIFHYGLKEKGFLVLGESESVGKFQYLFEPIISGGLIYRKKQAQPQVLTNDVFAPNVAKKTAEPIGKTDLLAVLGEKVDHLITSEYGPATLLVNNNLDIIVFRGDVAPFLSPESGVASFNVTKIIRKELRSQVQTALYRAKKEITAIKETVIFKQKGNQRVVNIEIRPLETAQYEEPFYLVLFTEGISSGTSLTKDVESVVLPGDVESLKDRQIRELREDLDATKRSLQSLVEGQQATNEELRSSMEEVQSSNEELQSTNEELETAKEELQSGNEELQTLNEELKNRNQTLGRLNDDLANLQMNIDASVVILDCDLKIRRFTASAQGLLKISPSDVGQSITNVTLDVNVADLKKVIMKVITNLAAVNQEVTCSEDRLCEMRVRPYLSEEKKIDGAVLTFIDITESRKAEKKLGEYQKNLEKLVEERTKQLRDSERLAAIGATAGMVGHDIRNPLQAIAGDVYLLKEELKGMPEREEKSNAEESLEGIEKNIEYINKIVADLQDFAKPLNPRAEETNLKLIIDDLLSKNSWPENVKISVTMEPEASKVMADSAYINRIMYNLVNNAVQAMPNGGKLTIQVCKEANDIIITVKDTGVGIPEAVKNKLFTPMFTTKAKGQGFGLPVIKRMTESLGGTVSFESEEDKGTTFMVRLPIKKTK